MWKTTNNPRDIATIKDRPIQYEDTVYINRQPVLQFVDGEMIDLVPTKKR